MWNVILCLTNQSEFLLKASPTSLNITRHRRMWHRGAISGMDGLGWGIWQQFSYQCVVLKWKEQQGKILNWEKQMGWRNDRVKGTKCDACGWGRWQESDKADRIQKINCPSIPVHEIMRMLMMLRMLTLMVVWWLRPEIVPLTPPLGQITSMQSNIPSKLSKKNPLEHFLIWSNFPFLNHYLERDISHQSSITSPAY